MSATRLWTRLRSLVVAPQDPFQRGLAAHITALLEPDSGRAGLPVVNSRRVVVEAGLSRVEVFRRGNGRVGVYLPLDAFLPGLAHLDAGRVQVLQALRAERVSGAHFVIERAALQALDLSQTTSDVAKLISEVLEQSPEGCTVSIQPEPEIDASDLLTSIRMLVKDKDQDSRRLVYQAVVNGWFYLPILSTDAPHGAPRPREWETPDDHLQWVAFSDKAALVEYHGSEQAYLIVSGIRLVRAARHQRVASLHINPSSAVGGQLYGTELETIVDYLDKMSIRG